MKDLVPPFEPIKTRGLFVSAIASSAVPGAYALLHDESKVAWVGRGLSWIESLGRNLRQLGQHVHACKDLQLSWAVGREYHGRDWDLVAAEGSDPQVQYRLLYLWCQEKGYKVLSQPPKKWYPVLEVLQDPRPRMGNQFLAFVWNKSPSGKKYLGGVFDSVTAAAAWSGSCFTVDGYSWEVQRSQDELTLEVLPMVVR